MLLRIARRRSLDVKTPVSLYDALMTVQVPQDKARDVADALESDMTTALASKQDLDSQALLLRHDMEAGFALLRQETKAGFELLRTEFQKEIATVRIELKKDLEALRVEFKRDLETLRAEFKKELDAIRAEFRNELAEQTTKLILLQGTLFAGGLGLLFAALKLTS